MHRVFGGSSSWESSVGGGVEVYVAKPQTCHQHSEPTDWVGMWLNWLLFHQTLHVHVGNDGWEWRAHGCAIYLLIKEVLDLEVRRPQAKFYKFQQLWCWDADSTWPLIPYFIVCCSRPRAMSCMPFFTIYLKPLLSYIRASFYFKQSHPPQVLLPFLYQNQSYSALCWHTFVVSPLLAPYIVFKNRFLYGFMFVCVCVYII